MKLIILIILITLCAACVNCAERGVTCNNEGEEKFDLNVQKMYLFGSPDRTYPTSDAEMKTYCGDNSDLQNQIKTYSNNCLKNLGKQIVNLLMYSVAKNNNNLCKSQKRKREFVQLGNCGNAAKPETIKCWNNLILNIDGVGYHKSDKLKLPLICCNFFRFKSCALKSYEKHAKQCNRKSIEGLDNLLNAYTIDTLRFMCGDYTDENDKCDQIVGETPKSNRTKLPKSPVSVFVKVIENFQEL